MKKYPDDFLPTLRQDYEADYYLASGHMRHLGAVNVADVPPENRQSLTAGKSTTAERKIRYSPEVVEAIETLWESRANCPAGRRAIFRMVQRFGDIDDKFFCDKKRDTP